jgi:HNH endonuclease
MPSIYIPADLRFTVLRARQSCEYCLIHQQDSPTTHEVDHIVAVKHGGKTETDNLALACLRYNRLKGSDLSAIDPFDGSIVALFNARLHAWKDHFEIAGVLLRGITPAGRSTVAVLRLNDRDRQRVRGHLVKAGRFPPSWM